ncbi:exopolysaccharide biosynthesis polyprenyl glycosylphosphotransferase [Deinococcus sp.]|uniref:exopolysaccharide biosynthesis polyprenyl glycosylphosphotransferase n=1 Tax=Deinococcus sp. TaxID=47478 RepID=UPI003B5B1511
MQIYRERALSLPMARFSLQRFWVRRLLNMAVLSLGDMAVLVLSLWLISHRGPLFPDQLFSGPWIAGTLVLWLSGAAVLQLTPGWGMGAPAEVKRLAELTLLLFISAAGALAISDSTNWLGFLGLAAGLLVAWGLIVLTRLTLRHLMIRASLWGVPVVIYGGGSTGRLLLASLQDSPGYGYFPVGIFDDADNLQQTQIRGVPVLGGSQDVLSDVPIAVLAMPGAGPTKVRELLEGPLSVYKSVVIIPDLFEVESLWMKACDFSGVLGLEVKRNLLDPVARFVKRSFDLLCVVLFAPLWVPLCLLLALLIWLDTHANPLFLQRRLGLNGELFKTWKFTTMYPDAEALLQRTLADNPELQAEWDANHKLRNDPRVTRVGGLLRKTSLDEVPQLVNVLLGQMSLVGPRPLPEYHARELSASAQGLRLRVRPGMTGLWQVSGRSAAGNLGMERWDPYYVRNWSIWLDVVILMRTLQVVLRGSGAY